MNEWWPEINIYFGLMAKKAITIGYIKFTVSLTTIYNYPVLFYLFSFFFCIVYSPMTILGLELIIFNFIS